MNNPYNNIRLQNQNNINNNLTREYNNTQKTNYNTHFGNNQMLSNNPRFANFVQENSFQDRINIAKMEKLRKAQNLKDLGMNNQELISYVINPIKIEKLEKKEKEDLLDKYHHQLTAYESLGKYSANKKEGVKSNVNAIVPKEIADLWNNRKNNPYKQILHFLNIDDYTKKNYKKENDLIIHKTTQLDKIADTKILKKELKKLEKLLFSHDNELKAIYSDDRKKKFLEKFEYESKNKNRIKYDPKNCSELKEAYKKQQKIINKQNKRIDDMIEMLMASDELTKEEMEEIRKIQELDDKQTQKYENFVENEVSNKDEKKKHKDLEKELEKEIQKELGKDEFKKLMKEIENIDDSDDSDDNKKDIKNKYKNRNNDNDNNDKDKNKEMPAKKIIMIKKKTEDKKDDEGKGECEENNIGTLSRSKLDKYKNR